MTDTLQTKDRTSFISLEGMVISTARATKGYGSNRRVIGWEVVVQFDDPVLLVDSDEADDERLQMTLQVPTTYIPPRVGERVTISFDPN